MTLVVKQEREKYSFYGGEVTLEYDPIDHVYLKDGIQQDGVTTVCKIVDKSNVLVPWGCKVMAEKLLSSVQFPITPEEFEKKVLEAKKAHQEKLEVAGDIGKISHYWIEEYIKEYISTGQYPEKQLPDDEKAKSCCTAALDWIRKHRVRWVCTEKKIYSKEYGYAGTTDGLAFVNSCDDPLCCIELFENRLSLIDWKTGRSIYPEHYYQTAAYLGAVLEEWRYV